MAAFHVAVLRILDLQPARRATMALIRTLCPHSSHPLCWAACCGARRKTIAASLFECTEWLTIPYCLSATTTLLTVSPLTFLPVVVAVRVLPSAEMTILLVVVGLPSIFVIDSNVQPEQIADFAWRTVPSEALKDFRGHGGAEA